MIEEFLSFLLTGEISNSFFSLIFVENVLLSNKIGRINPVEIPS